jgi:hypothetical protein
MVYWYSRYLWHMPKVDVPNLVAYLRATSPMRLRARDHCVSSTLIGGKGGAHSSLLEGPTEYVNATWIPTWRHMDHVSW